MMTEKRFKEIISTQKVIDNKTGKEYDCLLDNDLFELINEIAEENEQLKNEVYDWKASAEDYLKLGKSLKEENEQLKAKNNAYLQDIEVFKEENTTLKLENEWLKKENQELHKLNQEYINSLSDEKKETLSEMLNTILGDDEE